LDSCATDLIYRQVIDGVKKEEYVVPTREELETLMARCLYVDHGPGVDQLMVRVKLPHYCPDSLLRDGRTREVLTHGVLRAFVRLGLQTQPESAEYVKAEIVTGATSMWPMNFSAMFEAFRYTGPQLPLSEAVLAVNKDGVFVLDNKYTVMVGFHYYDIIDIECNSNGDSRRSNVRLKIIDGAQFTFLSPNSETIVKMISAFLDGLRRRSEWAVATQAFVLQDYTNTLGNNFRLHQGDLVHLQPAPEGQTQGPDWIFGCCIRTGSYGSFPRDSVYILPTIHRPADEFLSMLSAISQAVIDSLPKRRGGVVIATSLDEHGFESMA